MHPRTFATQRPDHPAAIIAETGESLSFGALEVAANRGAHLLRHSGLVAGDAMAIWLPNRLEYFEALWAGQRAGIHVVPLSTALTADEAAYILADSGAKLLVVDRSVHAAIDLLASHRPDALAHVFSVGEAIDGVHDWSVASGAFPPTPIADETAGATMFYSSGTTGRPKGVRQPLSGGPPDEPNMGAAMLAMRFGIGPDTVYLSPAPFYHAAPLVFCSVAQRLGATAVLTQKFDPEQLLAAVERYGVTFAQLVPTMFVRMLRLSDAVKAKYELSSLKEILHGAAPCPVEIKRGVIDWLGPIVSEYYAGSEGNGITFISASEWLAKPGSVGKAGMAPIRICDEDGAVLATGEAGTVYFEGAAAFRYHNDDEKSAASRHPLYPEWSTLGDVGYLDADGYLFLTDRKSFMIISGGVNIYPQETENLLITHPKVADAAVIGVPNDEMGEEVKAVIEPIDWADATPETAAELIAWCREHLSHIKCPRTIDFEMLPRAETGKLYKRLIRDRYWAGAGRAI
jgi:acyl-CoA synthetase (AMP-forming)/AMP-acid ligase II